MFNITNFLDKKISEIDPDQDRKEVLKQIAANLQNLNDIKYLMYTPLIQGDTTCIKDLIMADCYTANSIDEAFETFISYFWMDEALINRRETVEEFLKNSAEVVKAYFTKIVVVGKIIDKWVRNGAIIDKRTSLIDNMGFSYATASFWSIGYKSAISGRSCFVDLNIYNEPAKALESHNSWMNTTIYVNLHTENIPYRFYITDEAVKLVDFKKDIYTFITDVLKFTI